MINTKSPKKATIALEAIMVGLIFSGLLGFSAYLVYNKSLSAMDEEIKIGLLSTAQSAATSIDGTLHRTFNADTNKDDPAYLSQALPLEKIRQASQDVRYIYTNILVDGKIYFVVNPSPQNDGDGDGEPDAPPALMDPYSDYAEELMQSLTEGVAYVSKEPYTDEWGTFISAYAPFYDDEGNLVGTLGMDLELAGFFQRLANIQVVFEKASITIFFLGLVVGLAVWYMRRSHYNELRNLYLLEQELASTKRYYEDCFTESKGLQLRLTDAYEKSLIEKQNYLAARTTIQHYCQSYFPHADEASGNFNIGDWLTQLKQINGIENSVSVLSGNPLPDEVFGKPVFLLELFGNLLQSLTTVSTSNVYFKLGCDEELLNQWQLISKIEMESEPLSQQLCQVLQNKADIFVEEESGQMQEQDIAWLEIRRLSRLLPLIHTRIELDTGSEAPSLTILWKINKREESSQ
jgi:hypothetical protein